MSSRRGDGKVGRIFIAIYRTLTASYVCMTVTPSVEVQNAIPRGPLVGKLWLLDFERFSSFQ